MLKTLPVQNPMKNRDMLVLQVNFVTIVLNTSTNPNT